MHMIMWNPEFWIRFWQEVFNPEFYIPKNWGWEQPNFVSEVENPDE